MPFVKSQLLADDGVTVLGEAQSGTHTGAEFMDFFNTVGSTLGYSTTLADGSENPETQQQYVFRKAREYLANIYNSTKANEAADTARQTVLNDPFIL